MVGIWDMAFGLLSVNGTISIVITMAAGVDTGWVKLSFDKCF
jgi:hypothetical protein